MSDRTHSPTARRRLQISLGLLTLGLATALVASLLLAPTPTGASTTVYTCANPAVNPECSSCTAQQVCARIWYDLGSCCTSYDEVVCAPSCVPISQSSCRFKPRC